MDSNWVVETRNRANGWGFGWLTLVVLGLIGLMAVLGQAGCGALDLGETRDDTAATVVRLNELEAEQRKALAAAQASGDAEGAAKAEKGIKAVEQARKVTDAAGAILAASTNPDGTVNPEGAAGAVGSALMAINPLAGVGVTVLGGVLGGLWRRHQTAVARDAANRNLDAAKQIVKSIEAAKVEVPEFKAAFDLAVPVLNKQQDIATQDLVEVAKLEAKRGTRVA